MIVAHIIGVPLEESVLLLAPAGAAIATALVCAGRTTLRRLRNVTTSLPRSPSGV